jgi:hypothetical protein
MSTDDLMVIAPSQQRVDIVRQYDVSAGKQQTIEMVAGDMVATRLDTAAPATAVLPLPQKLNGHRSLLMLQSAAPRPRWFHSLPPARSLSIEQMIQMVVRSQRLRCVVRAQTIVVCAERCSSRMRIPAR